LYKKVSNRKMDELFSQAPLVQGQAQPLAQGQAQPLAQGLQTYPPSARASKKEQPIQPPQPPLVYNYQTIMNAVTKNKRTFSSYAPELQDKFKDEFKKKYNYELTGDDEQIKQTLLTRIYKDTNGGYRKTKNRKLNKKYLKSRKHK